VTGKVKDSFWLFIFGTAGGLLAYSLLRLLNDKVGFPAAFTTFGLLICIVLRMARLVGGLETDDEQPTSSGEQPNGSAPE
jgi:dipeptide/tripeptide permease